MPSWCQQFCSKLRDSVWFHADVFVILILTAHISLDKMIKKIKNPLETSVLQNKHSDHLYTTLLNTEDKSPSVQVAVLDFIRPRGGGLFLLSAPYPSSSHCSKCSWENKTAIPLGHQEAEAEILLLLLLWTNIWTSYSIQYLSLDTPSDCLDFRTLVLSQWLRFGWMSCSSFLHSSVPAPLFQLVW